MAGYKLSFLGLSLIMTIEKRKFKILNFSSRQMKAA